MAMQGWILVLIATVLTVGCGGTQTDAPTEPEATEAPSAEPGPDAGPVAEPAPDGGPGATVEQAPPQHGEAMPRGSLRGWMTFDMAPPVGSGPDARENVIRLNLQVGDEVQTHEVDRYRGACLLPGSARDAIDPEGPAAGSLLSFRCRHGIREEAVYRVVPALDALEVLRADRPLSHASGRPEGQGELIFRRVTMIRLPADVSVEMEQDYHDRVGTGGGGTPSGSGED